MDEKPELYFPRDVEWRQWLEVNHATHPQGVYLIMYKLEANIPTMRWEEAVRVALCYGWIDSTVKNLGGPKRRQYFCPRKPKSVWSALNKKYISEMEPLGLIHESGWNAINVARENGMWSALDNVENGIIPAELQAAFDANPKAWENYQSFAPGYRKSYLYWLHNAKREETRAKRIEQIIAYCEAGIKTRM